MEKETVIGTAREIGKSRRFIENSIRDFVEKNILAEITRQVTEMSVAGDIVIISVGKKKFYFVNTKFGFAITENKSSVTQFLPESYR